MRASSLNLQAQGSALAGLSSGREAAGNNALTLGVRSIPQPAPRVNRHALIIGIGVLLFGVPVLGSLVTLALLSAQPWRGNIRELRNVLEQAVLRCDSPHLEAADVAAVLREQGLPAVAPPAATGQATANEVAPPRTLAEQVGEVERRAIAQALRHTGGNKVAAARVLGISRAKLYERLALLPEFQAFA